MWEALEDDDHFKAKRCFFPNRLVRARAPKALTTPAEPANLRRLVALQQYEKWVEDSAANKRMTVKDNKSNRPLHSVLEAGVPVPAYSDRKTQGAMLHASIRAAARTSVTHDTPTAARSSIQGNRRKPSILKHQKTRRQGNSRVQFDEERNRVRQVRAETPYSSDEWDSDSTGSSVTYESRDDFSELTDLTSKALENGSGLLDGFMQSLQKMFQKIPEQSSESEEEDDDSGDESEAETLSVPERPPESPAKRSPERLETPKATVPVEPESENESSDDIDDFDIPSPPQLDRKRSGEEVAAESMVMAVQSLFGDEYATPDFSASQKIDPFHKSSGRRTVASLRPGSNIAVNLVSSKRNEESPQRVTDFPVVKQAPANQAQAGSLSAKSYRFSKARKMRKKLDETQKPPASPVKEDKPVAVAPVNPRKKPDGKALVKAEATKDEPPKLSSLEQPATPEAQILRQQAKDGSPRPSFPKEPATPEAQILGRSLQSKSPSEAPSPSKPPFSPRTRRDDAPSNLQIPEKDENSKERTPSPGPGQSRKRDSSRSPSPRLPAFLSAIRRMGKSRGDLDDSDESAYKTTIILTSNRSSLDPTGAVGRPETPGSLDDSTETEQTPEVREASSTPDSSSPNIGEDMGQILCATVDPVAHEQCANQCLSTIEDQNEERLLCSPDFLPELPQLGKETMSVDPLVSELQGQLEALAKGFTKGEEDANPSLLQIPGLEDSAQPAASQDDEGGEQTKEMGLCGQLMAVQETSVLVSADQKELLQAPPKTPANEPVAPVARASPMDFLEDAVAHASKELTAMAQMATAVAAEPKLAEPAPNESKQAPVVVVEPSEIDLAFSSDNQTVGEESRLIISVEMDPLSVLKENKDDGLGHVTVEPSYAETDKPETFSLANLASWRPKLSCFESGASETVVAVDTPKVLECFEDRKMEDWVDFQQGFFCSNEEEKKEEEKSV